MKACFSLTDSFPGPGASCQEAPQEHASRVACVGTVWLAEQPIVDLSHLQAWLDTHPDTDTWQELDGDFLLSYLSPENTCCILYRSLTGARTLYYRSTPRGWTWSTQIEDLFEGGVITYHDVDLALLPVLATAGEYLPEQTPYRDIWCLRAGQGTCFLPEGQKAIFQHDFRCQDLSRLSFEEAAETYRTLCARAIRRACYGAQRVSFFLSGGMDSAIMAKEAVDAGLDVVGFHWSWSQLPMFAPERACAQLLADHLHIPLEIVDGAPDIEVGGQYVQAMASLPLPYNHAFFCNFKRTADLASQHGVPLLLTGHLGDTLFQSEETDGIRYKPLLSRLGDLLTLYPRSYALKTLWEWGISGAERREALSASQAHQRIDQCLWLTPNARSQALARGQYRYSSHQPIAPFVYQAIQACINDEAHRDTLRIGYVSHPRGVTIRHPYLSRALIEFCLALPPHYRASFGAGRAVSKPLARYAYLNQLPADIIRREIRLPYVAVNERYALQNTEALYDLFCKDACLVREQIADQEQLERIITDADSLRAQSQSLLATAGVELWLRHLEGRTWKQPEPPRYALARAELPRLESGETGDYFSFAPDILVKEINTQLLLLQRTTQEVLKITPEGTLFLRLLARWPQVEEATTRYMHLTGSTCDVKEWQVWLDDLVSDQWILEKGQTTCLMERQPL